MGDNVPRRTFDQAKKTILVMSQIASNRAALVSGMGAAAQTLIEEICSELERGTLQFLKKARSQMRSNSTSLLTPAAKRRKVKPNAQETSKSSLRQISEEGIVKDPGFSSKVLKVPLSKAKSPTSKSKLADGKPTPLKGGKPIGKSENRPDTLPAGAGVWALGTRQARLLRYLRVFNMLGLIGNPDILPEANHLQPTEEQKKIDNLSLSSLFSALDSLWLSLDALLSSSSAVEVTEELRKASKENSVGTPLGRKPIPSKSKRPGGVSASDKQEQTKISPESALLQEMLTSLIKCFFLVNAPSKNPFTAFDGPNMETVTSPTVGAQTTGRPTKLLRLPTSSSMDCLELTAPSGALLQMEKGLDFQCLCRLLIMYADYAVFHRFAIRLG